uniref:NADH dehydrogenase subunit 4L n=1 Tax=Harringtonia lauricola TaxID=483707 RepID=UPI00292A471B|nr:NADH dehydrogenase subunit 4L [Harringtonia lauricola]WNK75964.1 NADH dehydrogenase subunit 4L [Harringtonia lauricola]
MNITLILFLIGILGFVLNRKNIILMLISIEIMLLSITFLILVSSLNIDDIIGQTYAIYIIIVAGAESAIGLGILVAFYRLNLSLLSFYLSHNHTSICKNVNKIPQQIRYYSTNTNNNSVSKYDNSSIDPWFITGIFDAESSFVVTILKNPRYKTGWNVQARVQIKMHEIDRVLIENIRKYFGNIGYISKFNEKNLTVEFRVSTLNDIIDIIIPHFDKYPLKTKKHVDFLLFKNIVVLMKNKEHNTIEGIQKIVNLKASLNTGLTEILKEAFPNTLALKELESNISYNNLDPKWMAGFCTGESNFFIAVQKSQTKIGLATSLRFSIAQHSRDLLLLESFVNFFNCGYVSNYKNRLICEFIVTKIDHLDKHIIPFFEENSILGSKYLNYLDFKQATQIIKNKEHLNKEGLEKILFLKNKITTFYKENL